MTYWTPSSSETHRKRSSLILPVGEPGSSWTNLRRFPMRKHAETPTLKTRFLLRRGFLSPATPGAELQLARLKPLQKDICEVYLPAFFPTLLAFPSPLQHHQHAMVRHECLPKPLTPKLPVVWRLPVWPDLTSVDRETADSMSLKLGGEGRTWSNQTKVWRHASHTCSIVRVFL